MSKLAKQLSIKPKLPKYLVNLIALACVSLFILLAYGAYKYGLLKGNAAYEADKVSIEQLELDNSELAVQLQSSNDELVLLRRHKQINEEAYKQMSSAYGSSEKENRYLESRLDFYRSIISPESGKEGPSIQALDQTWDGETLKFDITVVQAIKHKHQVQASVRALLYDGDDESQPVVLKWPQTSAKNIIFQYFQHISGEFAKVRVSDKARIKVELTLEDGTVSKRWFDVVKQT